MAEPITLWGVSWRLLAVLSLVLLNGFFVAAEFAIVKVRTSQIEMLVKQGNVRAKLAQQVVGRLDAYLSATQLGITLASLGLGWLGEPAIAVLLEPFFASIYVDNPAVVHTASFIVAFTFITFLHIVLGELAPKGLAIQKPESTSLAISRPLHVFYVLFRPFIFVLNGAANMLLRAVGIRPSDSELAHSEEELRLLLSESGRSRRLSKRRAEILLNVLDLRERAVDDIMVPRPQMTVLSTGRSLAENVEVARDSGYTRFPLARGGNVDDIIGMVHLKDLVWFTQSAPPNAQVTALRRDIMVVPETVAVETLLNRFLARRAHMALVIDEHGGTAGLVTLEDVIEEFLGEIQDEFDTEEAALIHELGDGEWIIDGSAPLHRVAEALDADFESEDASTFGGFVVEQMGRVPHPGSEVALEGFRVTVRSADRKRVKLAHVARVVPEEK